MASFVYNKGLEDMLNGTIAYLSDTIKIILENSTYASPNRDDLVVDTGGGADAESGEITATNYTRGWGGAGRKTLASKTIAVNQGSDRVEYDAADVTWTSLGGATNDTVVAAAMVKEGGANDTTSRLLAYLDITDTPTNGGDFTLNFNAAGIIHASTV